MSRHQYNILYSNIGLTIQGRSIKLTKRSIIVYLKQNDRISYIHKDKKPREFKKKRQIV